MSPEKKTSGTCILCGKPLPPKRVAYCSPTCAKRAYDIRQRDKEAEEREKEKERLKESAAKKRKTKKQIDASWARILKGMQKTGLSYGEYVARYEDGKP